MSKLLSADDAVRLIRDGATVAIGGTGPVLEPDLVLEALQRRFLTDGEPRGLAIFAPMMPGDRPGEGGMNAIAHEGLVSKVIGPSFSAYRHPRLLDLIRAEKCEGYTISMGVAVQLLTAIASRKPGVFTTVGTGTFLDPRVEGGKMNARSTDENVRIETLDGQEYLYYKTFPIDVALIRATTADENGYLSFEEEPNTLAALEIAAAAKASGGIVIAQVKRLAQAHSLNPQLVRVPGSLVDAIVLHPQQSQMSELMAEPLDGWNPAMSGWMKAPLSNMPPLEHGPGKVLMRRAALELRRGDVVNLGAGSPTHLPRIALEEGMLNDFVFTNEHGIFGGLMASHLGSFVPAFNPDAIMDSSFQFNFYEGGGLDITFLGVGQVDREGNVNVSKFGREWNGPGGFNTITERTKRIVICGTLTAGGFRGEVKDGKLNILQEGKVHKWVPAVEQLTFNAQRALSQGQQITYITERAVFQLTPGGPELVEIAPGVDLERDIKAQIEFPLQVSSKLRTFDPSLFAEGPICLRDHLNKTQLKERPA